MKLYLIALLTFGSVAVFAQASPEVMTLGTFHFNFPNLDVKQVSKEEQIDVLDPQYQKEIENIVRKIARFKPTVIVIERQPHRQHYTDSTFKSYLSGHYQLKRNEEEQIGFRLVKLLGIQKLYCVDEWGNFNEKIRDVVYGKDSVEANKFEAYFNNNPDSAKRFNPAPVFKTKGILAALKQDNDEAKVKKSLGNYLTGLFKYESSENDFAGVDFETGRWFSRNLKIFRNIQRIRTSASGRILVLYGAEHLNVLNYLFDCSPEYRRVRTNDFLQ